MNRRSEIVQDAALTSQVIEDWSEFLTLESEWNELLGRSGSDSIFLTWEWIHSCCEAVAWQIRPFVTVIRDGTGKLLGIAPFYIQPYRLPGSLRVPVLQLIPQTMNGSEYFDFIVDADRAREVYESIFSVLLAHRSRWTGLLIRKVAAWTGACARIIEAAEASGLRHRDRPSNFSAVELPESFDAYMTNALSRNSRSSVRRAVKRILRKDSTTIEHCSNESELEAYLSALFRLHHARWQLVGQSGSFRKHPVEEGFYRIFMPIALNRGWLRFFALKEKGEFRALQIGYVYGGAFNVMQEGFDPEFTNGAGKALRARVIELLIAEGVTTYDFLGEHSDHKRRWGAEERAGRDILIFNRSLPASLIAQAGIWPGGRALRLIE